MHNKKQDSPYKFKSKGNSDIENNNITILNKIRILVNSNNSDLQNKEVNQPKKVMMVTECSMSDNIQIENPNVDFVKPCNMCPHMKKITLPKILDCLENETGEIIMDKETIDKARISVERMAAIGR